MHTNLLPAHYAIADVKLKQALWLAFGSMTSRLWLSCIFKLCLYTSLNTIHSGLKRINALSLNGVSDATCNAVCKFWCISCAVIARVSSKSNINIKMVDTQMATLLCQHCAKSLSSTSFCLLLGFCLDAAEPPEIHLSTYMRDCCHYS